MIQKLFAITAGAMTAATLALIHSPLPAQAPPDVELQIVTSPPPEATADNSVVKIIDSFFEIPDDFWTHAGYGDVLLKNDFAAFTFGYVPENRDDFNPARQGSILDVFPNPSAPEAFQLFQPTTDNKLTGRTIVQTFMDYSTDTGSGASKVTVYGELISNADVAVDTTYVMEKGWPGVLATTTISNDSPAEIVLPMVGDFVGWGAMLPFTSGSGWMNQAGLVDDCEFVFGRYQDSIVFIMPAGDTTPFQFRYSRDGSALVFAFDAKLQPGETRTYSRWILTGLADPAKLYSFVIGQRNAASFGYIAGRVVERVTLPDGREMETGVVPGAEVRLSVIKRDDLPKSYLLRPYLFTLTDEYGNFQATLPAGEYSVSATSSARVFSPNKTGTRVNGGGKVTPGTIVVSRPSSLVFEIYDAETQEPIAGKVSLIPLRGTRPVDLGPPGKLASGAAAYSPTGKGIIEVPEGSYRVVASQGNEYHSQEKRVQIQQLRNETLRFELRRAFKTDGWISADIGVMTDASPHARISPLDRIITSMAEGLDWIVTADTDTATDLQPLIENIGASRRIHASKGIRLGSDASHHRGEYLLFPLEICSAGPNVSFDRFRETTNPTDAISLLRGLCPNAVLVANRPIFPEVGLLSVQGYDYQTGIFPEGDLQLSVDAFQVWEGKRQTIIEQGISAYRQVLARGELVTPIANSLSTGSYNEEPGYPRIYVPSTTENPTEFNVEEFAQAIKEGRVLVTNGPFIDLRVNGTEMGSLITDTDGTVDVTLRVFSPNWANVSEITVFLNGAFARKFILPAGSIDPEAGKVYPKDGEEDEFKLTVKEDSILSVLVSGDSALMQDPVNPLFLPTLDDGLQRGQYSLAISAPVFIDTDGNGVLDLDLKQFEETKPEDSTVPYF